MRMIEGDLYDLFWEGFLNARKLSMIFQCFWQDIDEDETETIIQVNTIHFLGFKMGNISTEISM